MERLLLECAVRALLVAAGTGIVLGALRVRTPAARHAAWSAVVLTMLLLPLWTAWGPKAAVPVLPSAVEIPIGIEPPPIAAMPVPSNSAAPARLPVPASPPAPRWNWRQTFESLYFLGFALLLARLLAGAVRAHLLLRRATSRDGMLTSDRFAAPVTIGWFHPAVLLPPNWPEWPAAELDAILAHEREHVRRRDPLVQWLALLNRAVFWFHPLAWWLERRLSRLAEEACDAAVLARGHDPCDYSEYLLGLARAVERAGAPARFCGMTMPGRFLAARIRSILEGGAAPAVSRRRMVCAAILGMLAVILCTACTLERVGGRASGQPTMNELMHRRADEDRRRWDANRKFVDNARKLSPPEVQSLEARLTANPHDEETRKKLVTYYQYKPDWKARDRHLLWVIENEPDAQWTAWPYADPNPAPEFYESARSILLARLDPPGAKPLAFERASTFVARGGDTPLAIQILLRGRKAYPDDKELAANLGSLYAQALVGSPTWNRRPNLTLAHSPFADKIRAQLAVSTDAYLLAQTAQALEHFPLPLNDTGIDFDVAGLALSYADRALATQPDLHLALVIRAQAELEDEFYRLARIGPEEAARAPAALRLRILIRQVQNASLEGKFDETGAHELLRLAAQNPADPRYGDAIYNANIALGRAALKNKDKQKAAQYLLAAAETPGSDRLRYLPIYGVTMSLPRSLVDWGERDAVAQFLDRCARFCDRGAQFRQWAAQIRHGINPDLTPYNASTLL